MYEDEIRFGKLLLKQSEMVLANLTQVTLTFDPVTPKSIGFLCYPEWMCRPGMRKVGKGILKLLIGNSFNTFDPGVIDLCPMTPKSIGFFCYPGWMCGPCLRRVGQGVLELLIGKKRLQTDSRPTCANQYALIKHNASYTILNMKTL